MGRVQGKDRRYKSRLRLPRIIRVRPSIPGVADFDEILSTLNASREGAYFISTNKTYREGMRVFITFPYSESQGSINRESLGEVVRIDELDNGRRGIAVQLLMSVYLGGSETLR